MENPKRAAVDTELPYLPEAVIHHIQSFLIGRKAAETMLVCKSWYNAWLTRPHLSLHLRGYQAREKKFLKSAMKTVQRYEDLKLNIESFDLLMEPESDWESACHSLAKKLILKAVKLGFVNLRIWASSFYLPNLESETLTELVVTCCDVYLEAMKCSRLRYLRLFNARFVYPDSFEDVDRLDLSSNLPCLTRLNLEDCHGYKHIQIRSSSLQFINLRDIYETTEFDVPNIQIFKFEGRVSSRIKFKHTPPKSDITINCEVVFPSWFSSLNQLLRDFRGSDVSLTINFGYMWKEDQSFHANAYTETGPVAVVENLQLLDSEHFEQLMGPTFFDGFFGRLFSSCHPKFIMLPHNEEQNSALRRLKGIMVGLHDLEEVNVEILEEKDGKWRSLSWEALSDASEYAADQKRMLRFQLKWRT